MLLVEHCGALEPREDKLVFGEGAVSEGVGVALRLLVPLFEQPEEE